LTTATYQAMVAQRSLLPHLTYIPMMYHDGVSWIAEAKMAKGPSLVGRGDSPRAALQDYDMQWAGQE
jgi:hypothetical protein